VVVYNKSQVGETSVFEIKCKLETRFWWFICDRCQAEVHDKEGSDEVGHILSLLLNFTSLLHYSC
jgi:hypothetical protein